MRPAQETFRQLAVTLICQPDLCDKIEFSLVVGIDPDGFKYRLLGYISNKQIDEMEAYFTVVLFLAEVPGVIMYTLSGGPTNV